MRGATFSVESRAHNDDRRDFTPNMHVLGWFTRTYASVFLIERVGTGGSSQWNRPRGQSGI